MIKLRVTGKPDELRDFVATVKDLFKVTGCESEYSRVYLDIEPVQVLRHSPVSAKAFEEAIKELDDFLNNIIIEKH